MTGWTVSKRVARCAMIAALYTAVSLALAPLSYNAVQVRVAEALTLLPVFTPDAIVGVTLGCLLTNLLGSSPVDAVFGTLATLFAALISWRLRGVRWRGLPLAAALSPVLVNALVVGAELTLLMGQGSSWPVLGLNILTVGAGELISCVGLGLLLVRCVEKNRALAAALQG